MTVSGITGQGINLIDHVIVDVDIMGRTVKRPLLVVRGISHCQALLGWDTIVEEGITLEGQTESAFIHDDGERWSVAAVVAARRTSILPRSVHKFEAVAMLTDSHVKEGEEGICTPLVNGKVGLWECLAKVGEHGRTTITVINTSDLVVHLKAGEQVGNMRNTTCTGETVTKLDNHTVASIMGVIGKDPPDPQRGQILPISPQERADLKKRLHIKAEGVWRSKFEQLLVDYHDVCSKNKYDLGRASVIKHSIRVKDSEPTHA